MTTRRRAHPAVTALAYLFALTVPISLVLTVIGSSPALLERAPAEYWGTVTAFGDGAARLSGPEGGIFGFDDDDSAAGTTYTAIGGLPLSDQGEWSRRRPEDFVPPAGLTPGPISLPATTSPCSLWAAADRRYRASHGRGGITSPAK